MKTVNNETRNKAGIEWTDATHNFWTGCHKVSAGCKFCYMHRGMEEDGFNPDVVRLRRADDFFNPCYWDEGRLIFTCSYSDFFIAEADAWRESAWAVIRATPQHTWQILTKRPERILDCLPDDWRDGYDNVWLGVSVENQDNIGRLDVLRDVPAKLRFISAEPLLEQVDFTVMSSSGKPTLDGFDWLILGGESGNDTGNYRYRPSEVAWYGKILKDVHGTTTVKVFVKQMGTYLAKQGIGSQISKDGKPINSKGGDFDYFPKQLQIREMP